MENLSEFKPLRCVALPGLGDLRCAGLILIVGPNSSGKTQFLRDITRRVSGEPRDLVVATSLDVDRPDHDEFIKCLKKEGYIYSTWSDNDEEQYVPTTTFVGTGQAPKPTGSNQLNQWRGYSDQAIKRKRQDEYWGWLSKFLVTVLFLENRLTSLNSVGTIDFESQPPSSDLHALHLSDEARNALTEEIQRAFSKAIWTCSARGNRLCLRIAENGSVPDATVRLSVPQMAKYRTIESEGDGMKSYVATVISLILGRRPITVIDEPELCLHPPQAYNLGQFLGLHATSHNRVTFVATHSSHILRGIVQTANDLQIVRLTRSSDGFSARHIESNVLAEALKKPTVRAETVLDGIFARAVTIIEGDGDRIVYQAAWEKVGAERNLDIHFASVGGAGGIADTCQMYRVLGIPVCVIADLDVLVDLPKIRLVLTNLGVDEQSRSMLVRDVGAVAEELRALPPTTEEKDVREQLQALADEEFNWQQGHDVELRAKLSEIRNSIDRMRRLKSGGLPSFPRELGSRIQSVVTRLEDVGLFLVPVGELEGWLSAAGINASKSKKWAWANEAAVYLRDSEAEEGDIWSFIRRIGDHLARQLG